MTDFNLQLSLIVLAAGLFAGCLVMQLMVYIGSKRFNGSSWGWIIPKIFGCSGFIVLVLLFNVS